MRGFLSPAVRRVANDSQKAFAKLPRGKRSKVAKLAMTTLIKADQWARGDLLTTDVAEALDKAYGSLKAKKK